MAAPRTIPIVRTGSANIASVCAAIERLGYTPELTESAAVVRNAEYLVLPGVGAFGAVMRRLNELNLTEPLRERINNAKPTLCICLGMQVLAEASEESPGVQGLSIIPGTVTRFPNQPDLRVPQLGWNTITADNTSRILNTGSVYFANSYRLTDTNALRAAGWSVATTEHAGPFAAAIEKGPVVACQFHPELSAHFGKHLIARWLNADTSHEEPTQSPGVKPRIIPCLDIRDGRIVKGIKFQGLRDAGDPVERARVYEEQGADELVILDVSATPEGRANAAETVAAVRAVLGIPLTVGGGVRAPEDAARLLDAGADKVGINTAAVKRPELISEIADRFGVQCTVVAIDAARRETNPGWEVVITSGTERTGIDAIEWCKQAEQRGAGEILLTSWDRDGTRSGYDTELLTAACEAVALPVIASGGVDTPAHMVEGLHTGATGLLAASIFHDGDWDVRKLKAELINQGAPLRAPSQTADQPTAEQPTRTTA